jgi:hypothetical protein
MMLSLHLTSFWVIYRIADIYRPSALQRQYTLLWMFIGSWVLLVVATVYEDRYGVASGYIAVSFELFVFLAVLLSFVELAALPSKSAFRDSVMDERRSEEVNTILPDPDGMIAPQSVENEEDAGETTRLIDDQGAQSGSGISADENESSKVCMFCEEAS